MICRTVKDCFSHKYCKRTTKIAIVGEMLPLMDGKVTVNYDRSDYLIVTVLNMYTMKISAHKSLVTS